MSEIIYLGSVLLSLAAYAAAAVAGWLVIECVHFIYCKIKGIKY
jgi:hypothetical protein